nr:zinc finger, CCHC-type [Tanacetum cinerariifolium]
MAVAAIKYMTSNFAKLDKFEGVAFRRMQKKMNFLLSSMSMVDTIFDPRPSQGSLVNGTEDIGGLMVPKEVTKEVVTQQPEPDLRKGKWNKTPKNFGLEFQLYLIKGTRDEVFDQHFYCFNVEDDPKIFDEAIKSQDVAF